jgi:hypothetical protein
MEVCLTADLQARLDEWAAATGRSTDELVEDAIFGYFDELAQVREMLDSRYDDVKSGRVKPMDGADALQRLRNKSETRCLTQRE